MKIEKFKKRPNGLYTIYLDNFNSYDFYEEIILKYELLITKTIEEDELKEYFVEFDKFDECKFGSRCIHENEPNCSVKEAVKENKIEKKRYDSYIQLLNEIRNKKRRY